MKRIFIFFIVIALVYFAKPLWEEPVSKYVDISFLEPVDEKVASLLTKESLTNAFQYVGDATDKAVLFFNSKLK